MGHTSTEEHRPLKAVGKTEGAQQPATTAPPGREHIATMVAICEATAPANPNGKLLQVDGRARGRQPLQPPESTLEQATTGQATNAQHQAGR
jgi:hypothetical protein